MNNHASYFRAQKSRWTRERGIGEEFPARCEQPISPTPSPPSSSAFNLLAVERCKAIAEKSKMNNARCRSNGRCMYCEQLGCRSPAVADRLSARGGRDCVEISVMQIALHHGLRKSLRKEVIQPQVLLRLPCYDLVPVTELAVGATETWRLRALPASMT